MIRIVLTGYPEVEVLVDAINRGHVYHFLTKPWQPHELRQVVRRGLERWEAAAERLRLLDEIRAACGRAEREAEQRARLLILAAHELGTPVHLLLNALALLREQLDPPPAAPWLDMADRAAEWLARGRGAAARRRLRRRPRAGAAIATGGVAGAHRRRARGDLHGERTGPRPRGRAEPSATRSSIRTGSRWRCRRCSPTPSGGRPTAAAST